MHQFREVARLEEGCSFGELALLKENEKRAAMVECSRLCKFATLHQQDYIFAFGQEERRKLKAFCLYMKNFRIFEHLRTQSLVRI